MIHCQREGAMARAVAIAVVIAPYCPYLQANLIKAKVIAGPQVGVGLAKRGLAVVFLIGLRIEYIVKKFV